MSGNGGRGYHYTTGVYQELYSTFLANRMCKQFVNRYIREGESYQKVRSMPKVCDVVQGQGWARQVVLLTAPMECAQNI